MGTVCWVCLVDDTDVIASRPTMESFSEAICALQAALDIWEGGLKATCGTIVPEKISGI